MPKKIISFGFKYGGPNSNGTTVIDVRKYFNRNPFRRKDLRGLTGKDPRVAEDVESTPGFDMSYKILREKVANAGTEVVCLGCTAGHHRSVYLTERIARELGATPLHRDINRK